MVLIADEHVQGAAPPFAFALEAELRPLEALVAKLRRSERLPETRQAIQAAAVRIEVLAREAGRVDVWRLADSLDSYFGDGEVLEATSSFGDAHVVCTILDLLAAKLPGAFPRTDVAELEAFLKATFETRSHAALAFVEANAQPVRRRPPSVDSPWEAVDVAIDRSYEAGCSDADLRIDGPEAAAEVAESAGDLERMIAAAFPEMETPAEVVEETPAPIEPKAMREKKASKKPKREKSSRKRGKRRDEGRETRDEVPPGSQAISNSELRTPNALAPPPARNLASSPTGEEVVSSDAPLDVEQATFAQAADPEATQPVESPRSKPVKHKGRRKKAKVAEAKPSAAETVAPIADDVAVPVQPADGAAPVDDAAQSATERDAWLHDSLLDRLQESCANATTAPTNSDAMLDLAAALDEYRAVAWGVGRTNAAELAGKLSEIPWHLAEQRAGPRPAAVDLLKSGVQTLLELSKGEESTERVASLVAAVADQLAAPAAAAEPVESIESETPASAVEKEDVAAEAKPAEIAPQEVAERETTAAPESAAEPSVAAEAPPDIDDLALGSADRPTEEFKDIGDLTAPVFTPSGSTNLLALYENETNELLTALAECVDALALDQCNADALNRAYITAHTYVGAAGTVGFTDCSRVAGHLESILERVLAGFTVWNAGAQSLLRAGVGLLQGRTPRESLPPALVASFCEHCAEWVAAQEAATPPTETESEPVVGGRFDKSSAEKVATDEIDEAVTGAAFELLAGVSEEELQAAEVPPDLLDVYTEEAEEHLGIVHAGLERLRFDPRNQESLQEVRRSAHTLKGAAGAVGLRAVAKLAHRMEDLLDELYSGERTLEPNAFDLLRRSTDLLGELSTRDQSAAEFKNQIDDLFDQYAAVEVAASKAKEPPRPAAPLPKLDDQPEPVRRAPSDAEPKPVDVPPASATRPVQQRTAPRLPAPVAAAARDDLQSGRAGNVLRVPLERIDDLVRLVSELVINRTAFEQRMADFIRLVEELKSSSNRLRTTSVEIQNEYEATAHRTTRTELVGAATSGGGGDAGFLPDFDALEFDRYTEFHLLTRALAESTGDVGTLTGELFNLVGDFDGLLNRQSRLARAIQDRLMRTRMVLLSSLAGRLDRTVRSAADALNKKAELELRGDATELDKTVLEEMIEPLLHLLRNCVDHGLERSDERLRAGKPERGRVFVHSYYQGTQIVIQVGDDGRGIDLEKLRTTAVRTGFLSAADAAEADADGLHQLLFIPGFSTADAVSEISGRGVGLDVVRSRVGRLKGTVTVDSTLGGGTTFTIQLPMTLAIARSLLVSAHGQTFAVPIQAVSQIVRVERANVGKVADGRVVFHGGRVFSLFQLGKTLGLAPVGAEDPALMPVLITYTGAREVAVQVDKIVAVREIVVKTLGTHLRRVHGMIGATILGDGAVVPILNLPELYSRNRMETHGAAPVAAKPLASGGLRVMVVDDSVSVRRVVSTMIDGHGWTPIQAKDGLDALEQLQKSPTPPDAILLDVEMPRMSGYDLLASLRSQDRFRRVPVVMVTSRAGEKHRRRALELGASDYIVKPFLEDLLVALLRRLTGAAKT